MSLLHNSFEQGFGYTGRVALILLALAAAENRAARAHDGGLPLPVTGKTDTTASKPGSIKENVKKLGHEITDPTTPARIKAHEQELEKKIESTRDRQRKDHGRAKPGDAVDLAKSLGSTDEAAGKAKIDDKAKSGDKAKVEGKAKPDGKTKGEAKPAANSTGTAKPQPAP